MLSTYFVILAFGKVVLVSGPMTDEVCRTGMFEAENNITAAFARGRAPDMLLGHPLTRSDLVLGCLKAASRPVIEGETVTTKEK